MNAIVRNIKEKVGAMLSQTFGASSATPSEELSMPLSRLADLFSIPGENRDPAHVHRDVVRQADTINKLLAEKLDSYSLDEVAFRMAFRDFYDAVKNADDAEGITIVPEVLVLMQNHGKHIQAPLERAKREVETMGEPSDFLHVAFKLSEGRDVAAEYSAFASFADKLPDFLKQYDISRQSAEYARKVALPPYSLVTILPRHH